MGMELDHSQEKKELRLWVSESRVFRRIFRLGNEGIM
jgi:hypothetical protein